MQVIGVTEISKHLCVAKSSVVNIRNHHSRYGTVRPFDQGGTVPQKLTDDVLEVIKYGSCKSPVHMLVKYRIVWLESRSVIKITSRHHELFRKESETSWVNDTQENNVKSKGGFFTGEPSENR